METETLSARNVVELLFDKQFGAGICPPDAELIASVEEGEGVSLKHEDDVEAEKKKGSWGGTGAEGRIYGWDC